MATGGVNGGANQYTSDNCWGEGADERQLREVDTFSVTGLEQHSVHVDCKIKPAALQQVVEYLVRFGEVSIRDQQCLEVVRVCSQEITMGGGRTTLVSSVTQSDERYAPGDTNCQPPERWANTDLETRGEIWQQAAEQRATGTPRVLKVNRFSLECWPEHHEWPHVTAVGDMHSNIKLERGISGAGVSWKMDPWMGDL